MPAQEPPTTAAPPPPYVQKLPEHVNIPATAPLGEHAELTAGVIQVSVFASQNKEPDVMPTDPAHPAPTAAPPAIVIHDAPLQNNAPTVAAPEQGVPTAGVTQVAPLQNKPPDTIPYPEHMPPAVAVPPEPVVMNVLVV